MATSFFQRQETARTNTAWLVFLFFVAVIGIVGSVSVVAYFVTSNAVQGQPSGYDPNTDPREFGGEAPPPADPITVALLCGVVATGVIFLGSLYKIISLRAGGGASVAESVGGRPLIVDTATPDEKKVLNIVEEMAIAAGMPVPPVYLLDEPGINAFAAGYRPADAVVGVTRGAVETLNREQLQGVIAHEFSHILNGDMRMNIRMIGILHGILLLALIGRLLFHSLRFAGTGSRSSDDKGRGGLIVALLIAGVVLLVLGFIGSFIGGLIKASISRQREYLADASAVQFTRNPDGIAGALKRIGAVSQHGILNNANASVASHLYFAQGVFEGFTGLMATHPPLEKRILAIEPNWDGSLDVRRPTIPTPAPKKAAAQNDRSPLGGMAGMAVAAAVMAEGATTDTNMAAPVQPVVTAASVRDASHDVGEPKERHYEYSAKLLQAIDPQLKDAASEPYAARALIFALLLDSDAEIAKGQLTQVGTRFHQAFVTLTERLAERVKTSSEAARLPLVDLALPMLRRMTKPQYTLFMAAFDDLVRADQRLSIFEWTLAQVLRRNLAAQFNPANGSSAFNTRPASLTVEVSLLLTMMARVGQSEPEVPAAFSSATKKFPSLALKILPVADCSFARLDQALAKIRQSSERFRVEVLDACAEAVTADGRVLVREAELLRGIADLLECPMPPILDAQMPT